MIVAVVVVPQSQNVINNAPPPFAELGDEIALERLVRSVVRGPFGVTIVAVAPEHSARASEVLSGFAVQNQKLKSANNPVPEAIDLAIAFRERWLKLRAQASDRFAEKKSERPERSSKKSDTDWAKHRSSADVKIRGLARSFDRDGIMIIAADHPAISPELQAQVVEAFGREAADKGASARPIAQAVYQGERGYPVIFDFNVASEISKLPAGTDFDKWLLDNVQRVQDVVVQEPAAVASLRTDADLNHICELLKIKR